MRPVCLGRERCQRAAQHVAACSLLCPKRAGGSRRAPHPPAVSPPNQSSGLQGDTPAGRGVRSSSVLLPPSHSHHPPVSSTHLATSVAPVRPPPLVLSQLHTPAPFKFLALSLLDPAWPVHALRRLCVPHFDRVISPARLRWHPVRRRLAASAQTQRTGAPSVSDQH
jgi:hypothetical protein